MVDLTRTLVLLAATCTWLGAAPITIDFEGFADGTLLSSQYSGLTFSNTIILTAGVGLNEFEFPPHSPVNIVADYGGPMSIAFASPIQSFSGFFTYSQALTIDAFSTANALVASATSAFSNNEALSGMFGSSPNELLQVQSSLGIHSLTISGNPSGSSFTLDDVTYSPGAAAVPEPPTSVMLILPLILIVVWQYLRIIPMRLAAWAHHEFCYPFLYVTGRGCIVTLACVLLTFATGIGAPAARGANLGTAYSLPASITPNTQYTLTVFITISNAGVIPGSVNLLRLRSNSEPVILGELHDDGQNGDIALSDSVYTLQVPITEPVVGTIQLQVSAALRGQLRRVVSPILVVPVTSEAGLPPDPGPTGIVTLAGIDSDGDGIRDDVERYIGLTYPQSARIRSALTDVAKAAQTLINDEADNLATTDDAILLARAYACTVGIVGTTAAAQLLTNLRAQVLNTIDRSQAYLSADSQLGGQIYTVPATADQQKAMCSFSSDALAN